MEQAGGQSWGARERKAEDPRADSSNPVHGAGKLRLANEWWEQADLYEGMMGCRSQQTKSAVSSSRRAGTAPGSVMLCSFTIGPSLRLHPVLLVHQTVGCSRDIIAADTKQLFGVGCA